MNLNDRPYLETEVVKVKKEKPTKKYCPRCGSELISEKPLKSRDNIINGENLDKIKFPCFCSFMNLGRKYYGMINKDFKDDIKTISYNLVEIGQQDNCVNAIWDYDSLKDLFGNREKDVHILKGKIILFEDDTEDEYSDE